MKKFGISLLAVTLLVFASLTSYARDPGNGPFPLLIGDRIWTSPEGDVEMVFKESKDNPKQMDLFVSSNCRTSFFGSSEFLQRLNKHTFVMTIRDGTGQLWYGFFRISEKSQIVHLMITNGVQEFKFGTNPGKVSPSLTCL